MKPIEVVIKNEPVKVIIKKEKKPWYRNNWVIVPLLLGFPYVGIPWMWKFANYSGPLKVILTGLELFGIIYLSTLYNTFWLVIILIASSVILSKFVDSELKWKGGENIMKKKIVLGIIGFIVLMSVIGAIAGSGKKETSPATSSGEQKQEAQKPKEQEAPPSPMKISARDLADDFDANQVAAEAKWKDKLVEFSAEISNITDSGISFYNVATKEFSLSQISCKISDKQQLMSLKNGQTVTVRGVVKGQSLGVISINDCQVVESNTPVPNTTSSLTPTSKSTPKTEEKTPSGVSMEQFNRIQEGMSYQEVVSILGSSGEVLSSSDMAGYKTVMYMWNGNSLGANMNAMFQNDKMVSKAQFGLK